MSDPKSRTISEPARELPVSAVYDVIVVGGGVAGVSAALAAARNGATVALLEKEYGLGGLATLGNVIVYEPLCDGLGNQIIGGIAEELLKRSVQDLRRTCTRLGLEPAPTCWAPGGEAEERGKKRYKARFNPAAFQIELEAVLGECGVEIWYDTRLCQVRKEGSRISHLIVENKDGRTAMACGAVIDASGDADVCALAGEETESLASNVLAGWHYVLRDDELSLRAITKRFAADGSTEGAEGPFFRGDCARDVTQQVLQTRAWIREQMIAMRAAKPEVDIQPFALPSFPNFRMTRRLVSSLTLGGEHDQMWFDDCVGMTGHWRSTRKGTVLCLPYRALRAERTRNLLVAGRCISAAGEAWDITRVIPPCAVSGEAVGTAAALAVAHTGGDSHALSLPLLQDRLRSQGAIIERTLLRGQVTAVAVAG